MNNKFSSKVNMYDTVRNTFLQFETVVSGSPALMSSVSELNDSVETLKGLMNEQAHSLSWITKQKSELMQQTLEKMFAVNKVLIAYALASGNEELKDQIEGSKTRFFSGTMQEKMSRISHGIEIFEQHVPALLPYGVSITDLEDLIEKRDSLTEKISAPRTAIVNRKQKTRMIVEKITEIDRLLKDEIDAIMLILKPIDPLFYHTYKDARILITVGSRHRTSGDSSETTTGTNPIV